MYIDDFYKLPISTPFEIHLQWFAAEDEGRTEEPTEHKLRKAREEGKVVKSSEFTSALILLSSIVVLAILSSGILKTMLNMLKFFLVNSSEIDVTKSAIVSKAFISFFVKISAPIFIVAFVAALLGNIFQVGFMFTVKPITPDIKKIIPNTNQLIIVIAKRK